MKYTGPVIRIRRSNDNQESDFYNSEFFDGTVEAWVGSNNNGYLKTLYDQSGNNLHLEQNETGLQPLVIVSGSASFFSEILVNSEDGHILTIQYN